MFYPDMDSNSPTPSTPSSIHSAPEPLYTSLDQVGPARKSHARKQPPGYVPRPCNAFILFRCDFVRQKKIPESVEHDHRNISRIAGKIWREMSDEEKAPWVDMAERVRQRHQQTFPGYRYNPSNQQGRKRKGKVENKDKGPALIVVPPLLPGRRSSSCPPPGAAPAQPTPISGGTPITKDDLHRRPSKVVMYHSRDPAIPEPVPELQDTSLTPNEETITFPGLIGSNNVPLYPSSFGRIAPPADQPGWDAAPPVPLLWLDYVGPPPSSDLPASLGPQSVNTCLGDDLTCFTYPDTIPPSDSSPQFTNPFAAERSLIAQSSYADDLFSFDGHCDYTGATTLISDPFGHQAGSSNQSSIINGYDANVIYNMATASSNRLYSSTYHPTYDPNFDNTGNMIPRLSLEDTDPKFVTPEFEHETDSMLG